jgi:hypothetical protein
MATKSSHFCRSKIKENISALLLDKLTSLATMRKVLLPDYDERLGD